MADSLDSLPINPSARHRKRSAKGESFAERLRVTALGVAAFIATCLCIYALRPEPEITGVSSKLRYYAAHQDEFDTVFIGTSRIYYQVSPEIFDRAAAARGMPTRSFNLGVAGMHPPESFLLLERFLKLKPPKLKWVFLELEDVQAGWDPERRGTRRLVYWHNWRLTSLAIRKSINPAGDKPWYMVFFRCWSNTVALHLKLFLQNLANVGTISDLNDVFSPARDPDEAVHELGPRGDGYQAGHDAMPAEQVSDYTSKLARAVAESEPRPIDPYAEAEYRKVAQLVRAFGATPIFLVPPNLPQNPLRFREPPAVPGTIIAFNDVKMYPAFYDPAVRYDTGHLSWRGAETFSQAFAERFVSEVRAQEIR